MMINELMESKNITKYRLAKNSGIPYTTINDICSGKHKSKSVPPKLYIEYQKSLAYQWKVLLNHALKLVLILNYLKVILVMPLKKREI